VVFATSEHVSTLLKLAPKVPCLKLVVIIGSIPVQSAKVYIEWGQSVGIRVQEWHDRTFFTHEQYLQNLTFSSVEAYGKAHLIEPIKPTPDTIASICYTSVSGISPLCQPLNSHRPLAREPPIGLKASALLG
jgi:long-chain acyl-CoA synthetase